MLFKLISRLFQRRKNPGRKAEQQVATLERATQLMFSGDHQGAADLFRVYLKSDPYDLPALNNLGYCLATVGDQAGAAAAFELSGSLDDTFVVGITNRAKLLNDQRQIAQALPLLRQAKTCDPGSTHVNAIYSSVCLSLGEATKAKEFSLRAWLGNFDDLRNANSYLCYCTYGDFDEATTSMEHRFWAETLRPESAARPDDSSRVVRRTSADLISAEDTPEDDVPRPKRIRIGYWSPDFRNHSVRYFFRPLLEGHDQGRFEIFLYHDFPNDDEQTALISAAGAHFHDICEFSDDDLHTLILSHQLDVLVELTGHMSYNRVSLLRRRFATLQMTGLGYPPTTGLTTVDAKIVDRHVYTPDAAHFYTEYPLALPSSFWCFDPKEDIPHPTEAPADRNGYVTFACVGNTAKISEKNLACWSSVLSRVESSRLLIHSLTLEDAAAEQALRDKLAGAGIPMDRVDLRKPERGAAYFTSYNEIDIVLDTFPFNGGTTTCFATYMGVPVVSWYGDSLVSRMGLSILTNLGVPELAVSNAADYIERAVALAADIPFLQRFRRDVRARYQQTSLGNGKRFAKEFEDACVALLEKKASGTFTYRHAIPPLPANELIRRLFAVLQHGQKEAADRVLKHCLTHYPHCASAHNLVAQQMSADGNTVEATDYLLSRIDQFTEKEQVGTLITALRMFLILGQKPRAKQMLERLQALPVGDVFDRTQIQLYRAVEALQAEHEPPAMPDDVGDATQHIHVLVPCDDPVRFDAVCEQLSSICLRPKNWNLSFERCGETTRITAYEAALNDPGYDALVIAQKNTEVHNPQFLFEIVGALRNCDVVGFAGALRWTRLDWRQDDFDVKAGSLLVGSGEVTGAVELQLLGIAPGGRLARNMAVLDGGLFAVKRGAAVGLRFTADLLGAETLLEEYWLHTVSRKRRSLAVHCNLGVLIDSSLGLNSGNAKIARCWIADKFYFNPLDEAPSDNLRATAPVAHPYEAVRAMDAFLAE